MCYFLKGYIMHRRLILALIPLLLMVSLTPMDARGESWVLWTKTEYTRTTSVNNVTWEINNAYPDHKQCMQAKTQIWKLKYEFAIEDMKKYEMFSEVKKTPNELIIKRFKDPKDISRIAESFYCFPGTLDPRERK
jgi:hypothetical protein